MRTTKTTNALLWTIQVLLAALFLFAGAMKLFIIPAAALAAQSEFPVLFLRFIGLAELLGGLGLVLPGLTRVQTRLTPLAAAGLVIIMIGATGLTATHGIAAAAFPAVVGLLSVYVTYGRLRPSAPAHAA